MWFGKHLGKNNFWLCTVAQENTQWHLSKASAFNTVTTQTDNEMLLSQGHPTVTRELLWLRFYSVCEPREIKAKQITKVKPNEIEKYPERWRRKRHLEYTLRVWVVKESPANWIQNVQERPNEWNKYRQREVMKSNRFIPVLHEGQTEF